MKEYTQKEKGDKKMKEIFDEKYVYFIWKDELKDKNCFVSNSIENLKFFVNNNKSEIITKLKKSVDNSMPFVKENGGTQYIFAYYDPHYEEKWAYYNEGKTIQIYVGDNKWDDVKNDMAEFIFCCNNTRLRIKENDKYAELKKAYKEGKTIQYNLDGEWVDWENPNFDDESKEYRIKPTELKNIDITGLKFKCWKCGKEITSDTISNIVYASNPPKYTCKDCEKLELNSLHPDIEIDNIKHNILEKVYKILKDYDKRISDLEDYCNFLK